MLRLLLNLLSIQFQRVGNDFTEGSCGSCIEVARSKVNGLERRCSKDYGYDK